MYETRKRSGIQLFYPFEEKRLNKWGFPVIVQPKLDGWRARDMAVAYEDIVLLSSTEELITSVPHIYQELDKCIPDLDTELDGELYIHGYTYEQIESILGRTVNYHPDYAKMEYHVFDIIDEKQDQWSRLFELKQLSKSFPPHIKLVPHYVCHDWEDVWQAYARIIGDGYEGIILRHPAAPYIRRRSTLGMKYKPKKDDWYTVVSVTEGKGKHLGMLGSVEFIGDDDALGDTGNVGTGFTDAQRKEYWGQDITGWLIHVEYQSITPGKRVPRFGAFLELVNPKEVL